MSSRTAEAGALNLADDVARRRSLHRAWRRRSRLIHFYRKALPGLIGAILLVLSVWVLANTLAWRFGPQEGQGGVAIRMVNAKFFGRSGGDAPYVVSAASAVRDERDLARVALTRPVFTQNMDTPTQTTLTAAGGVYRDDTRVLSLEKDVVVVDRRGYNFKTQRAVVDTVKGTVQGESPIEGTGPLGRIASSSYSVQDGGQRIIFRGNVRGRIERGAGR